MTGTRHTPVSTWRAALFCGWGGHRLALSLVAIAGVAASIRFTPPPVQPADAPDAVFSAARAWKHLNVLAAAPRPVASAHHDAVVDYIVETAQLLGLKVTADSAEVVREDWGNPFPAATVRNIVARQPGADGSRALLVVGHYDSVPTGPGAADNGASVAAMLETMRAVVRGRPVRHDVVYLFTDAEEVGGLGAASFVERHRLNDYAVVINFEARGSRGPSLMFESSDDNASLIEAFANAGPGPVGNSLSYEVYRHMPLDTDFTVFRQNGARGLNFAFIHGFHNYHSAADTTNQLDPRSLQHHGDMMLALVRHLGSADLGNLSAGSVIYFDVLGTWVVRYPVGAAVPLSAITLLTMAFALARARRRGFIRAGRLALSAAALLAAAALSGALCLIAWKLLIALQPERAALPFAEPYQRGWYISGFLVLATASVACCGHFLARCCRLGEVLGAAATTFGFLAAGCSLAAPGASYLFQWAAIASLPSLWRLGHGGGNGSQTKGDIARAMMPPMVAALIFVPLMDALFVGLGLQLALVPVFLSSLALTLALPLAMALGHLDRWAIAAGISALVVLALGAMSFRYDESSPRQNCLIYVQDPDIGARWASSDPVPDEWTASALGNSQRREVMDVYFPSLKEPLLVAAAKDLGLPLPTIEIIEETVSGHQRVLRLRLSSPRHAPMLQVQIDERTPLIAATIAGQRLDAKTLARQGEGASGTVLQYWAPPAQGMEIVLEVPKETKVPLRVTDVAYELPAGAWKQVGQRPTTTTPAAFGWSLSDASVVSRHVIL